MITAVYFVVAAVFVGLMAWWLLIKPGSDYRKAIQKPFPAGWQTILYRNLPIYRNLPNEQQNELQDLIKGFLHQKNFVGCDGQLITDEIRVTIAAEACLLLLNRPHTLYRQLKYIYVYPSAYLAPHTEVAEGGVVTHRKQGRSGESWQNGKVILSWDDVAHGARNFSDGQNVVLHEFAHQLDQESGSANGAPLLSQATSYQSWARVLSREFSELQDDLMRGHQGLLDHYGATNPAEFFAVATETFYERPDKMMEEHPELFEQLMEYFQVDPRKWQ